MRARRIDRLQAWPGRSSTDCGASSRVPREQVHVVKRTRVPRAFRIAVPQTTPIQCRQSRRSGVLQVTGSDTLIVTDLPAPASQPSCSSAGMSSRVDRRKASSFRRCLRIASRCCSLSCSGTESQRDDSNPSCRVATLTVFKSAVQLPLRRSDQSTARWGNG